MRRKIIAWWLAGCLAICLSGCGQGSADDGQKGSDESENSVVQESSGVQEKSGDPVLTDESGKSADVLTVYCWRYVESQNGTEYSRMKHTVEQAVTEAVRESCPELTVEYYDPTEGDPTIELSTAMQKLASDLMVGKGPDVIIGSNEFDRVSGTDILKQARSGMFSDLTDFIAGDERFCAIPEGICQSARIGDAQYVLPLFYRLGAHVTAEDVLDQCGVAEEELTGDPDRAVRALRSYMDGEAPRSMLYNTEHLGADKELLAFLWPDTEELQEGLESDLFRQVMEIQKLGREKSGGLLDDAVWESYTYGGQEYQSLQNYSELRAKAVAEGDALWLCEFADLTDLCEDAAALEPLGGAKLLAFPNASGGGTARIMEYAVIRASSSRQALAQAYIDAYYDTALGNTRDWVQLPVSEADLGDLYEQAAGKVSAGGVLELESRFGEMPWFESWLAECRKKIDSGELASVSGDPLLAAVPLPEDLKEQVEAINASVTGAFYSYLPYELVLECFEDYFAGNASFDSCRQDAAFQLELYLSE